MDKGSTSQINYVSNVATSGLLMIQWMEQFRIMKIHTEDRNSGALHRLSHDNQRQAAGEEKLYRFHQQVKVDMIRSREIKIQL